MLFHSYDFLLYFLLPLLLAFRVVPPAFRMYLLVVASFVFYAQWNLLHLSLLFGSILVNYFSALAFRRLSHGALGMVWLVVGLNLLTLGYFKYSGFLTLSDGDILLPLAISFYTFQQIAYIVDIYKRRVAPGSFWEYLFFVMFFPQLIAGPIVHYANLMGEVKSGVLERFDVQKFQAGLVLFCMGLFSKVVLAESFVREVYDGWVGVFSYGFMIYFDFSGYANMAIGLALLFGVTLPMNFDSPYKSRNMVEFWRRWHMTLGRFLKEHIYIPLGGSKHGFGTQAFALLGTMVVGGVWHGAGWGFLIWGFLHGVGLVVAHLSRFELPKFLAIGLTFLYVNLLWVFFYAPDLESAFRVYGQLASSQAFVMRQDEIALLLLGLFVVWALPNAAETLQMKEGTLRVQKWHGVLAGSLFFISLKTLALSPASSFVYFNF